jgi:hypothetical protein
MKRLLPLTLLALFLVAGVGCDSTEEDSIDGDSSVTGTIINSQTGGGLADALVTFSRGEASRDDVTDESGEFTIDGIATGPYTVTISAEGFIDRVINDYEVGEGMNEFPSNLAVVTEAPPAGAYRIVLSWGERPSDLDSHITGPDGQGGRFHVYYADQEFGDVADLDVDDVTSFGPETVTLTPSNDGLYRYSVFNFSNQGDDGSQGIAGEIEDSEPALVQVYTENELIREYTAPASTPGNTWRIFEMTVDGDDVSISDVNTYVDASGSGDIGVFRMPGK